MGHEFGHYAQAESMGFLSTNNGGNSTAALCDCAHVVGSNQQHCIQSREYYTQALKEGFGHFFSSKIWNDEAQNNCGFGYYKEFLNLNNEVEDVPVAFSCRTPHLWRNNNCGKTDRGVEMDWMAFFWSWHTREDNGGTGSRASMTEILDVLDRARVIDGGSEIHWNSLRQAAENKWGWNTPKYNNFRYWAEDHGVWN